MRIPVYLAVAQWALLLALGMLVITAYRQLGRVLGRSSEPSDLGPAAGSRPGRIAYERISAASQDPASGVLTAFEPGEGIPALVAFVDPTCPTCEQLVGALTQAREGGDLDGVRVLLLTSDPPAYLKISAVFQATTLEIGRPADSADLERYRATATPLLVAIDAGGVVRAAGTAARPAEVRAFTQACLLPPAGELLPVTG